MKKLILIIFFLSFVASAEIDYIKPIYEPSEVEKLVIDYLRASHSELDLSKYKFWNLSYEYKSGTWTASFECKEVALSCHFGVQLSNEKQPKFTFYPGL